MTSVIDMPAHVLLQVFDHFSGRWLILVKCQQSKPCVGVNVLIASAGLLFG